MILSAFAWLLAAVLLLLLAGCALTESTMSGRGMQPMTGPEVQAVMSKTRYRWEAAAGATGTAMTSGDGRIRVIWATGAVNGRIRFTVPSSPAGVRVTGVELEFKDGVVVDATAQEGEGYLRRALATDPGASRLGELGIGTNFGIDRPIGAILFDEKIGGTVHLALGRSYSETGGQNVSALHWDLICDLRDGGRLSGDGRPILENGRFVG